MPAYRYYYEGTLLPNDEVVIEGPEVHHMRSVMRGALGDTVEVVNGKGYLAVGSIVDVKKNKATIAIESVERKEKEKGALILAQAMPRANRLDTILEKATELGVTKIRLFPGERSEQKEVRENRISRIKLLLVSAMKQCGRLYLPEWEVKPALKQWKEVSEVGFFGDVAEKGAFLYEEVSRCGVDEDIIFFVGPEAGFTEREEEVLRERGVKGVSLHGNILRTDTAALMALSLISHWKAEKGLCNSL
jgi:16S rRNA (uracil1498-N3)-methyltransferase